MALILSATQLGTRAIEPENKRTLYQTRLLIDSSPLKDIGEFHLDIAHSGTHLFDKATFRDPSNNKITVNLGLGEPYEPKKSLTKRLKNSPVKTITGLFEQKKTDAKQDGRQTGIRIEATDGVEVKRGIIDGLSLIMHDIPHIYAVKFNAPAQLDMKSLLSIKSEFKPIGGEYSNRINPNGLSEQLSFEGEECFKKGSLEDIAKTHNSPAQTIDIVNTDRVQLRRINQVIADSLQQGGRINLTLTPQQQLPDSANQNNKLTFN